MRPSVDIWWTPGPAGEPARARPAAAELTAVPAEWRRGVRGRFLEDVVRRSRAGAPHRNARGVARGWRFNLAAGQHLSLTDSGPCLIVAVGHGAPIGIDAERVRPVDDALATVARLGLHRHAEIMARLSAGARQRAFAHIWTAFEAFLKLERLPWDAAAARFRSFQNEWQFAIDGTARFAGLKTGLVFQPVYDIPGILLTVAAPLSFGISVQNWGCDRSAMPKGKSIHPLHAELRSAAKPL